MLEISRVGVYRGQLEVVRDVSLAVDRGQCVGLLGLNGAGKTTLLSAVAGSLPVATGSVTLDGTNVSALTSWARCARGLVLVPAGRQLFGELSVLDNLLVGGHTERSRRARAARLDEVFEHFPILHDKKHQRARELSGGQQQMVAFGRGLMAGPKALLLDEPSEGLAPIMVDTIFAAIRTMRESGSIAILLAEQNAGIADLCDAVLVIRDGEVVGGPERVAAGEIARSVFDVA